MLCGPLAQVSYHSLQVIFQHLHLTRGAPPAGGVGGSGPPAAPGMAPQPYQQQLGGMGQVGGGLLIPRHTPSGMVPFMVAGLVCKAAKMEIVLRPA
jgi:hypothetical protein